MRISLPTAVLLVATLAIGPGCSELALSRAAGGSFEEAEAPPEYDGDDNAWDDDDAAGDDDDDDGAGGGYGSPERVDPPAGSDTHHYRDPVTVWFDGDGRGASMRLIDGEGRTIPTLREWDEDGAWLTLRPEDPLLPDSPYAVVIDVATEIRVDFRTSRVGIAVENPQLISGATFSLNANEARVHRPEGLGSLYAGGTSGLAWLWQVGEVEVSPDPERSSSLGLDSGIAFEDGGSLAQDLCVPTADLGAAALSAASSYFWTEPSDFSLHLGSDTLVFEEGWVDGDFLPEGDGLANVGLHGMLRADSARGLLSGDDVCLLLEEIAAEGCEPCPSGDGMCIPVELDGVSGYPRGEDLEPVDADGTGEECEGDAAEVLGCSAASSAGGLSGLALLPLLGLLRRNRRRA